MFASIDRVYDASKARDRLGFVCRTGFAEILESLRWSSCRTAGLEARGPQEVSRAPWAS